MFTRNDSKLQKPRKCNLLADIHVIGCCAIAYRRCSVRSLHCRRSTLTLPLPPSLSFSVRSIFRRLCRLFLHCRLCWRRCTNCGTAVWCSWLLCRFWLARLCHGWLACFSCFHVTNSFWCSVLHWFAHVMSFSHVFHRRVWCRWWPTSLPLSLLNQTANTYSNQCKYATHPLIFRQKFCCRRTSCARVCV